MSVSQTKLIEISEQSLNWIFQKGMRFILILLQQFSQRAYTVYTSYARINDSPYKALTRTSLRFDLYSDELLDKSKLTTPKDAFVVVVLGSNVV